MARVEVITGSRKHVEGQSFEMRPNKLRRDEFASTAMLIPRRWGGLLNICENKAVRERAIRGWG
jgi:hypothetical protein